MRFPPQFLDELRARLPVSEVVGRRVKLKRAGREFKGLSPFNQEKTPSFTVNDQKGFYHDFSSGKHGDIFGFVMETEGVTFPEAVERLASMAGLPMPKVSREDEAREERRKTLHDVVEIAAKFFEATLAARARRQSARLSRRSRARSGDATEIPHRLRAGGTLRAERASRQGRRVGRGHDRGRARDCRRRHSGALRSLPRSRDLSDLRLARARDCVRRARARSRRAGEISQLAGDAALSQGLQSL